MLNLIDELREKKELTKTTNESLSLVSTPGNPFMPSSRLVSDSDKMGSTWVEAGERTSKHTLVLDIVNQQLNSAQHALEKAPDSPFLLNSLGLSYLNAGKVDEAVQYFERALNVNGDLISARFNLAKAQLLRGNLDGALSIYTSLLTQYPRRAVIHESLGEIYLRLALAQGDKSYLEKAKHQLAESGESNPSALNNLGIVCMLQGNLRVALGHFKKSLNIEPRSAKTHFNIATCYVQERNFEKAVRHFVSSLSLDKQNVEAAKGLARVYLLARKYQQVVELLRDHERFGNEDAQLLEILGEALFYSKNYRDCLNCMLRAQKIYEASKTVPTALGRVYNNLGSAYLALGNREKAGIFFKKSVRESPDVLNDAHCNLFAFYLDENRFEEALPLIQIIDKGAALKSAAWQARFYFLAARYYLSQKDYEVSSRYLVAAKSVDPTNPSSYVGISYMLSEIKGDYVGAIEILKQGISHAPTNLMLLNNLAYNYLMNGEIENARGVLDRINEKDALESPHVYATRGLRLVKEGELEEGARLYNHASILAQDEETRAQVRQKKNLEIGRYFLSKGKVERAKKLLEEVFKIDSRLGLYKEQAAGLLKGC